MIHYPTKEESLTGVGWSGEKEANKPRHAGGWNREELGGEVGEMEDP